MTTCRNIAISLLRVDGWTNNAAAGSINPIASGWMQYYGRFYRSGVYRILARINPYLVRWIRNKYRRLASTRPARQQFAALTEATPALFVHWRWIRSAW